MAKEHKINGNCWVNTKRAKYLAEGKYIFDRNPDLDYVSVGLGTSGRMLLRVVVAASRSWAKHET